MEGEFVEKKTHYIAERLIKGFTIGASMLVPGASGGTMAIILGVYDELIHGVSSLRQNIKENLILLGTYTLAGLVGILVMSRPLLAALELWNKPMLFLFLGAILGGIPPLYRNVRVAKVKPVNFFVAMIGAVIGISTMYLPEGLIRISAGFDIFHFSMLILAGLVIAIALILPGISASYVLLMLGMYQMTLTAIREFNLFYLIPLAVGVLGGTFLTAGILEREMKRHPQFTYMLIIGFMMGSVVQVFPGIPAGSEIPACLAAFFTGLSVILWLGRKRVY